MTPNQFQSDVFLVSLANAAIYWWLSATEVSFKGGVMLNKHWCSSAT